MSEEEKMRMAMDLAKQGIDLEDVEKIALDIYEYLKPILELAKKIRKYLINIVKERIKKMNKTIENIAILICVTIIWVALLITITITSRDDEKIKFLDIQELQAINKKVEELGWNEKS